ncbi:PDZ domain-containing protein [Paeniglutamicibacter sp. NPDC012692]|uniref:YlbL family protein n=1 Tax=Paeniglutamicibacter sp. NPDC012692 TaxID=3364388 RepID=UPI0036C51A61
MPAVPGTPESSRNDAAAPNPRMTGDPDGADHRPLWRRIPFAAGAGGAQGTQGTSAAPQSAAAHRGMAVAGWIVVGTIALAAVLPTHFVVESAGPALNTIGKVEGTKMLTVTGKPTYPTSGELDMTTVYVQGGGQHRLGFFNVLGGWIDPKKDVLPEEMVLPRGTTSEQQSEQNTVMMDDSQQLSTAAALHELDIPFTRHLSVAGFATEQNSKTLKTGDRLVAINGTAIDDLDLLKKELQKAGEKPSELEILRGGKPLTVTVNTAAGQGGQRQLGIMLGSGFDFPLDVKFGLENVGGPSAGMMFALAIVDELTPGEMTGGKHFAGTGAITADGQVQPIGGIAQKMVGAKANGAQVFLAPADNCADVVGRVPAGLDVVKVETLDQARAAVEGIGSGKDPGSFPSCR